MVDRILAALVLAGLCALAVFAFQRHEAAPFCRDDGVTAQVTSQISAELGRSGFDIANIQQTAGGIFARARQCQMDVAPIISLQTIDTEQWLRVLYMVQRPETGDVTVAAHIAGPAEMHFVASN
jgi:hypothetical protein